MIHRGNSLWTWTEKKDVIDIINIRWHYRPLSLRCLEGRGYTGQLLDIAGFKDQIRFYSVYNINVPVSETLRVSETLPDFTYLLMADHATVRV